MNIPFNHFDEKDKLPICKLYRRITANCEMSDQEIMDWAYGKDENINHSLITGEEIVEEINNDVVSEPNVYNDTSSVINELNVLIKWGESNNLELDDLLMLRRIREKVISRSINKN